LKRRTNISALIVIYFWFLESAMEGLKDLFFNQCVVSCSTLTSEIRTAAELQPLVPDNSNYHVVAMLPAEGSYRRGWQLLADIVRSDLAKYPCGLCRNKVLDLMLPL
jgi:hypothetical protein